MEGMRVVQFTEIERSAIAITKANGLMITSTSDI